MVRSLTYSDALAHAKNTTNQDVVPPGWHPISVAAERCEVAPSMVSSWVRQDLLPVMMAKSPVRGPKEVRHVLLSDVQHLAWDARRRTTPEGRVQLFRTVPFTLEEKAELVQLRDLYSKVNRLGSRRIPIREFVMLAARDLLDGSI